MAAPVPPPAAPPMPAPASAPIKPPPPAALAPRMAAPAAALQGSLVSEEPADLPQLAAAPSPSPAPTPVASDAIAEAMEATHAELVGTAEEQKATTPFDRRACAAADRGPRA